MSASQNLLHEDYKVATTIQRSIKKSGVCIDAKGLPHWLAQVGLTCFVVSIASQAIGLFTAGDTEKFFECFSTFTFCSMGALKVISLRTKQGEWTALLSDLHNLEVEQLNQNSSIIDHEIDDEDAANCFVKHIKGYTEKFRFLSAMLLRVYFSTCIIFISAPFLEFIYRKLNSQELNKLYPHVLSGWSPLDHLGFWGYLLMLSIEFVAAIYTVLFHLVFDLMVFGLMIFLSGQFVLLRDLSEGVAGPGRVYDQTPRNDEQAHFRIMRCHRILKILEMYDSIYKLEKLVQNILGIYFFVAVLTLCSISMRLASEEMSVMKVVSLLQYIGACLTQLFLFCYYGDMVLHKTCLTIKYGVDVTRNIHRICGTLQRLLESSINMGEGVYAAAWWRLTPRLRREVMLFGAWQARVRRLRAGPFNSLDLPSFIQVLRAAYSYYAVLRKRE